LPPHLDGGGADRLRDLRVRPLALPRFPLLGQRRSVHRRRGHPGGRRLPAHPAQGRLPAAVPDPPHLPPRPPPPPPAPSPGAWRPGRIGALRMGTEHGAWCVGCCWGLMAALFALGVMSIGWMVLVAALIATEKLLPWKGIASGGIAVLLVLLGLAVAFVPGRVPGLTLPGSAEAAQAMDSMGMGDNSRPMHDSGGMTDRPAMPNAGR